jgi:hypothetical protein
MKFSYFLYEISLAGSGAELNKYLHSMKNQTGSGPPDEEPEGISFIFTVFLNITCEHKSRNKHDIYIVSL